MSAPNPEWLRPSALPKLALCGHFRGDKNVRAAATRGSFLDAWFREQIRDKPARLNDADEDAAAVNWAVDTARALAGDCGLESDEEWLKIEACGLTGTADLLCTEGQWSADLKSGQKRNYYEQQAAYALGFMELYFVDEWTVYLLFCDLREVETLRFTREGAERTVREAIANAYDDGPPTTNEYCGWCAARFTCPARLEAVSIAVKDGAPLLINATSKQLREFVLRAGVVEDFATWARELLKGRIVNGEKVPGCALVSRRGARLLPERQIELQMLKLGIGHVLAAYGPLSEAKAKALWARTDLPFPEEQVEEMPGSTHVRVDRPRSAK